MLLSNESSQPEHDCPSPSPREVRARISSSARRRSTPQGVAIFAYHVISYCLFFAAALYFDSWLVKAVFGVILGLSIAGAFMVGHDAAHDSFTPHSWLNAVIARIAFLPSLNPYTAWKYTHNYLHHGYTNLKTHDTVWRPHSPAEYNAMPPWRRLLERVYRSLPGLPLNWIFANWIPHRLFPRRHEIKGMRRWKGRVADQCLVVSFAMAQVACVAAYVLSFEQPLGRQVLSLGLNLFFCVLLPFLVWSTLISLVDLVQHTHPSLPWFKTKDEWTFFQAQVGATAHWELPPPLRLFAHNILEHNAHHVDPRIPMYHLHDAQNALTRCYPRHIVHPTLSLQQVREIFRTCQLYDYDNHCWTTFAGTPSTPRLLPIVASVVSGDESR